MNAKVQKWGNSLAVRIPRSFAREVGLTPGATVDLSLHEGKIVIKSRPKPEYCLEELLKGVTTKNLHGEIDVGEAVGREAW